MHSFVRRAAYRAERLASGWLTQPWRAHRQFEEQYLKRLLKELSVDCVLDVGANIGQYALMLREYCHYEGLIISFEPTPEVLRTLLRNSRRDRLWEVRGIALGNFNGHAVFHTTPSADSVGNSFLERRQEHKNLIDVEVEVCKLSGILPGLQKTFGFSRPFLKMDTQGFDLEVFSGAREVIHSIVGLQSELAVEPVYNGAPGWHEAIAVYEQAGFTLSTFVANNLDFFPRLLEMDCIMYRPVYYQNRGDSRRNIASVSQ